MGVRAIPLLALERERNKDRHTIKKIIKRRTRKGGTIELFGLLKGLRRSREPRPGVTVQISGEFFRRPSLRIQVIQGAPIYNCVRTYTKVMKLSSRNVHLLLVRTRYRSKSTILFLCYGQQGRRRVAITGAQITRYSIASTRSSPSK